MSALRIVRAPDHREFIGEEFGAGPSGEDPRALSLPEIMADEKLSVLGRDVYDKLREQFAEPMGGESYVETPEEEEYRLKLEGWADILEILLEETLAELESLHAARAGAAPGSS